MGIPKKGSRVITVDNIEYRWLVSRGKNQQLSLVIELKENPGQKLVTYFDSCRAYAKDSEGQWVPIKQCRTIRPSFVQNLIKYSIEAGWSPSSKSKPPFVLENSPSLVPKLESESLPSDAIVPAELLTGYLYDILDEVSLCPAWRKKILESPVFEKIDSPKNPHAGFGDKDEHKKIQDANLNFVVFNDGISPCKDWFVIGVQCVEFPSEAVYSTNGADVWIGE
ncbi:MAG: hypothetical protein OQK04_13185 [Kangiellaceae bacterium]|nr:hypothetical protein [Kangiellaceae bacterium]MCW8999655.1 hypothetical protein [Kangiellaceae bacterium]